MMFSLDDAGKKDSTTSILQHKIPLLDYRGVVPLNKPGVIKKVLFTRTEITIYPNGQTFQKTTSWFDKQTYQVTKKVKKKAAPMKKTVKKEVESY